jgi:hypothetical protein
MIEGPIGDMVERSQARQDFQVPPKLMEARPTLQEHPEASMIVLTCADPRLDPGEILSLNKIAGKYSISQALSLKQAEKK